MPAQTMVPPASEGRSILGILLRSLKPPRAHLDLASTNQSWGKKAFRADPAAYLQRSCFTDQVKWPTHSTSRLSWDRIEASQKPRSATKLKFSTPFDSVFPRKASKLDFFWLSQNQN